MYGGQYLAYMVTDANSCREIISILCFNESTPGKRGVDVMMRVAMKSGKFGHQVNSDTHLQTA